MGQNPERKSYGNLTIKYSRWSDFSPPAQRKLESSFDLARRAVQGALRVLDTIQSQRDLKVVALGAVPGPGAGHTLGAAPYEILRFHFRLPHDRGEWRFAILRIANNLRQIQLGLSTPVAIADAHSTLYGLAKGAQLARFTTQENEDLELAMLLNPPADVERWRQQWRNDRADDIAKATALGHAEGIRKSVESRGLVAVKNSFMNTLTPEQKAKYARSRKEVPEDRSTHLAGDKKGSIHLNFPLLLNDPSVTLASVAQTIIHEASHKFCDTRDFHYACSEGYFQMSTAQAVLNADSYGYAAMSLFKNHLFRWDQDLVTPRSGIETNA